MSNQNTISFAHTPVGPLSHVVKPKTNTDQQHDANSKGVGSVAQDVPSNLADEDDAVFDQVGCCSHTASVMPNLTLRKRLVGTSDLSYTSSMDKITATEILNSAHDALIDYMIDEDVYVEDVKMLSANTLRLTLTNSQEFNVQITAV